jgi:hypothetical protein
MKVVDCVIVAAPSGRQEMPPKPGNMFPSRAEMPVVVLCYVRDVP